MAQSERGLYETLVTEAMEVQLAALAGRLQARRSELHEAEAADRIALHLARVIERAIASLDKRVRVKVGTRLARQLVDQIVAATEAGELASERPVEAGMCCAACLGGCLMAVTRRSMRLSFLYLIRRC
jgi:hypothetical protein